MTEAKRPAPTESSDPSGSDDVCPYCFGTFYDASGLLCSCVEIEESPAPLIIIAILSIVATVLALVLKG
jgi:hypothetical protein